MDENTADSSWKKMVIAKSNNEWISTLKNEEYNSERRNHFFRNELNLISNIKRENNDSEANVKYSEIEEPIIQEVDPLMIPSARRRSKDSIQKSETSEQRVARLAKMSAYAARRLANESPQQRANRLKRMSEYAAKRLANETQEQRSKRLARMSAYAAKRLSEESPEQRKKRLQRMSAYAARRQLMKKSIHYDFPKNNLEQNSTSFEDYLSSVMSNQS